jgi:hypothetical protein
MCNKFRKKKSAKNCVAALAVLLSLALCTATVFGAIRNGNHSGAEYAQYQMNKTLTQTNGVYELELTAGGRVTDQPIYTVLVVDATSSMGAKDEGPESRWDVVLEAAKVYVDAYFQDDNIGRDRYLAVVSFGYGARVHVPERMKDAYGLVANASNLVSTNGKSPRTKSPGGKPVRDFYIGGFREGDEFIHAFFAEDANEEYKAYTDKNAFFFRENAAGGFSFGGETSQDASVGEIKNLLANISQYSGTNNEAGLLLAKDLLDNVGSSPYKNVVLISDGESPATSTFAWLYEQPLADGVHLGNVYEYTTDADYVQGLYARAVYSGSGRNVNFFDGNWHNVDRYASKGQRVAIAEDMIEKAKALAKTTTAAAVLTGELADLPTYFEGLPNKGLDPGWTEVAAGAEDAIDLGSDREPLPFMQNTHTLLSAIGAYNAKMKEYIATGGAVTAADAAFWNKSVNGLFWQGGLLSNPPEEYTLYDASDFSHMPNAANKVPASKVLDYRENEKKTNQYGSDSARDITGQSAARVKAKGYTLYYIAAGNDVLYPKKLKYYASDNSSTQHFYIAKQNPQDVSEDPSYVGFDAAAGIFKKIAAESLSPTRGVIIHDRMADCFTVDVENIQHAVVTRYYYAEDGETQLADILTNPKPVAGEEGLYRFDVARGDPVSIRISSDGKTIDTSVGTLWDTSTARKQAVSEASRNKEVCYSKASVKFPVLADEEAIGRNSWKPSNSEAYFSFDGGRSPNYRTPEIIFSTGGGGPSTPEPEPEEEPGDAEEPGEEEEPGDEEEPNSPDEETPEAPEETAPTVPPGTPVQPGAPGVPPVPYFPGSSLIPLDDGGFLEIDEDGVPLGIWEYDDDEEAWIFDESIPFAALPQTGGIMPDAGFTNLWVFPLLSLLWFGLLWPRLRKYIGARAK